MIFSLVICGFGLGVATPGCHQNLSPFPLSKHHTQVSDYRCADAPQGAVMAVEGRLRGCGRLLAALSLRARFLWVVVAISFVASLSLLTSLTLHYGRRDSCKTKEIAPQKPSSLGFDGVLWSEEHLMTSRWAYQARKFAEWKYKKGEGCLLFTHIFKCGGSTMCRMAQLQNQVVLPPYHLKCKPTLLTSPKGYKPIENGSPEFSFWFPFQALDATSQLQYFQKNLSGVTFISNEIGAGPEMILPGEVVYVTTLREPVARAISGALYNCRVHGHWGSYNCSKSVAENVLSSGCQAEAFRDGTILDKIGPCASIYFAPSGYPTISQEAYRETLLSFCTGPISKRFRQAAQRLEKFYSAVLLTENMR